MDIEKMDPNLKAVSGNCEGAKFISAHDERFSLHGVYYDKEEKIYRRVPESVASQVSDYLVALGKMTAGGRIRFITDSPYIAIKAVLPYFSIMSHMTITGSHGFSVYADGVFQNRYSPVPKALIKPLPKGEMIYFADKKPLLKEKGKKLVEIYFPLYGGVSELFIGVEPNSIIEKAPDYAGAFYDYSVRKATTGSFFAALREGMMPAIKVRITLIAIRMRATDMGSCARK